MSAGQALLLAWGALLVAAGALVARRVRGSGDFFVAGRALPAGLVCATLLAANIGAGSTVGATGLAYGFGPAAWFWSGSAALGCVGLGLWVAPRLHALASQRGFLTLGDFLEARYDRGTRGLLGLVLCGASLLILAGQVIAMAWALQAVAGVPRAWGCLLSGLVLVAYFSGGGLLAAAWVNVLELGVLLLGFALAVPFAWSAAGGAAGLRAASAATAPMPSALLAGLLVTLVPAFVVSPGLVQKTWGARTPREARRAVLWNAAALLLFACVPVILGLCARRIRPGLAQPEMALPVLLAEVLPPWLGGLGLAALFAAEISTADAVLFMLSTSLARDLYHAYLRPDADDATLLRLARRSAWGAGALGTALALLLPTVVDALKAFYGVLSVALFAPLVIGLMTPRPGARQARRAIAASCAALLALRLLLAGSPHAAWAPYLAAMALSALVLLWPTPRRA